MHQIKANSCPHLHDALPVRQRAVAHWLLTLKRRFWRWEGTQYSPCSEETHARSASLSSKECLSPCPTSCQPTKRHNLSQSFQSYVRCHIPCHSCPRRLSLRKLCSHARPPCCRVLPIVRSSFSHSTIHLCPVEGTNPALCTYRSSVNTQKPVHCGPKQKASS
jgi:hypothetical protein